MPEEVTDYTEKKGKIKVFFLFNKNEDSEARKTKK